MELTLIVISIWIFSTCLHEFGHAITAYWSGDKTVKDKGYLSLNPISYFNSGTTLVIPILVLLIGGIPLPGAAVYINTGKIKSRLALTMVSLAGPLFTLLALIALIFAFQALSSASGLAFHGYADLLQQSIGLLIFLHVYVLILNLLPIPPLDGWGAIEPWLPADLQKTARRYSNLGFILLILLFWYCDPFVIFMQSLSLTVAELAGVDWHSIRDSLGILRNNALPLVGLILIAWILKSKMAPPQEKAKALMRKGENKEALELYEKSLARKEDPQTRLEYASCLLSQGRAKDALASIATVLDSEPDNARAFGLQAACLVETGENARAVEVADKAISISEEPIPFCYLIKAQAAQELGNSKQALEAIDTYLSSDPENANALFIKSQILECESLFEEALTHYARIMRSRNREGFNRACLARGILLCALDRKDEAMSEFEKVLPKGKNDQEKKDRQEDLINLRALMQESAQAFRVRGQDVQANNLIRSANTIT